MNDPFRRHELDRYLNDIRIDQLFFGGDFMRNWLLLAGVMILAGWAVYDFATNNQSKDDAITEAIQEQIEQGEYDPTAASGATQLNVGKGDQAPDFTLTNLDGDVVNLSDYLGKKVLVNFWASWCPPCRDEMPDMQTYHEQYDDAVILAVNMTEAERVVDDVHDFLDEFGITFDVLLDENSDVANLYTAYALPTSYFIDTKGVVQEKVIGEIDLALMKKTFKKMN